jgi:magnesium chelatase family protein
MKVTSNARMPHGNIRKHCSIHSTPGDLLQKAMAQLSLSACAYNRILKVARTMADLAAIERIGSRHLLEPSSIAAFIVQSFISPVLVHSIPAAA